MTLLDVALRNLPGRWQLWATAGEESSWLLPLTDPTAQLAAVRARGGVVEQGCVLTPNTDIIQAPPRDATTLF